MVGLNITRTRAIRTNAIILVCTNSSSELMSLQTPIYRVLVILQVDNLGNADQAHERMSRVSFDQTPHRLICCRLSYLSIEESCEYAVILQLSVVSSKALEKQFIAL